MNETVEIIVPVYNVEAYLTRCIDSLLGQTQSDIRVWLVDDGSTDECPSICDRYAKSDPRVAVIHKENGGQASARNSALNRIFEMPAPERGGWIAFVDSDDWVEPDFIGFLLRLAEETGADIAQCGHWITYSHDRETEKRSDRKLHLFGEQNALESILRNGIWDVTAWNKLYRLPVFEGLRFPESIYYEDTAIAPHLALRADLMAARMDPKYHYVQRYDSTANGIRWTARKLDFIPVGDEAARTALERHPDLGSAALEKRVFVRLSTLAQMVNAGHYDNKLIRGMRDFVVRNSGKLLLDPAASGRTKLGTLLIIPGFWLFRTVWKLYYMALRRR